MAPDDCPSPTGPSPTGVADRGDADAAWRRLIHECHGPDARIRLLSDTPAFGKPVFVVDFDDGPQHYRVLGAVKTPPSHPFGEPLWDPFDEADAEPGGGVTGLIELSAMDLVYPARLVSHRERLMSVVFALCGHPGRALMLGVGGASMWRFVRAYVPECTVTLVDQDETIASIARRWFYVNQPVIVDTAERFLSGTAERFDAVVVDLTDGQGSAVLGADFWVRCLGVLRPGGCLTTNWADLDNPRLRPMAEAQAEVARAWGHTSFFVTRRGMRDNIIQYLPTAGDAGPGTIAAALEGFAGARNLPESHRAALGDCIVSTRFPLPP